MLAIVALPGIIEAILPQHAQPTIRRAAQPEPRQRHAVVEPLHAGTGAGVALSAMSYGGTNPLLQELAAIGNASMLITFGFDPAQSLRSLTNNTTGPTTTATP